MLTTYKVRNIATRKVYADNLKTFNLAVKASRCIIGEETEIVKTIVEVINKYERTKLVRWD